MPQLLSTAFSSSAGGLGKRATSALPRSATRVPACASTVKLANLELGALVDVGHRNIFRFARAPRKQISCCKRDTGTIPAFFEGRSRLLGEISAHCRSLRKWDGSASRALV